MAKQRIERLEIVANSQPLAQTVEQAVRLLGQSELDRKEVYVFSDLSRAAWPSDAAAALQDALAAVPGAAVYLIDVGVQEPVNFALGEVRLSQQVLSNRGALDVQSEVVLHGPGRPADRGTPPGRRQPAADGDAVGRASRGRSNFASKA